MSKKHYAVATSLSVVILFVGIAIGTFFFSVRTVHAETAVEEVTPSISTGTALFHTALAHRLVADQIIVGDHDMGKLLQNLLNLMVSKSSALGGSSYTQAELQAVIDSSKLDKPIRIKAPAQSEAPKENKK